jgi:hypothetical protein
MWPPDACLWPVFKQSAMKISLTLYLVPLIMTDIDLFTSDYEYRYISLALSNYSIYTTSDTSFR